jgi:putative NADPH-quinone reductase
MDIQTLKRSGSATPWRRHMRRVQGRSGHEVRTLTIAEIDVPFLRSQDEWMHGALPAQFENAQEALKWADHLVIVYPLWLGDVPAYLKACLEQIARPGFACSAPT